MDKSFKVRSWIICDDVRMESSGKHILVGVYPGAIRLRKPPPISVSSLVIWMQLELTKIDYGEYELRILASRDRTLARFHGPARFKNTEEPATLICPTGTLTLPDYGTYRIELGLGGPPKLLGIFAVRPMEDVTTRDVARLYPTDAKLSRRH